MSAALKPVEDPSKLKDTFVYEGEDAVYLVQYDSEEGSGDGWEEPRQEARAWVHRLWIASTPIFEKRISIRNAEGKHLRTEILDRTAGKDWVEIPTSCLSPGLIESMESEAHDHAFPGPPED